MKVLIDNGHGADTAGKCSPDKSLREYRWAREIAARIVAELKAKGYDAERIVPEDRDISLGERCRRVNAICDKLGRQNVILVSIHSNAAGGDGQWHNATGFCVMVGRKASEKSKRLARLIYDQADKRGLRGNRSVPPTHYWVQGLAMCDSTNCPAVLVEAMFYDNRDDLALLQSAEGKEKIAASVVEGITKYVDSL